METNEQTKVEYTFLLVTVEGFVFGQDGEPLDEGVTLNDFAAQGWRFLAVVRTDSEKRHPALLMQREGK